MTDCSRCTPARLPEPACAHDCGMCDGPLTFAERVGDAVAWRCTVCDHTHWSIDCCKPITSGPTWEGPCPFADARVRPSPCADPTTEDNRTPIKVGMKLFNYYDGEWGVVLSTPSAQGWFDFGLIKHDRITTLNGVRVSTKEPQR